jgi:hypothetical protein
MAAQKEIRQIVCGGCVGYGFDKDIFMAGIARKRPDYITYDCGSIDPGPYYLGEGVCFIPKIAAKIDLDIALSAGILNKIPVILTTAGGSGANVHLNYFLEVLFPLAVIGQEHHFGVGTVYQAAFQQRSGFVALFSGADLQLGQRILNQGGFSAGQRFTDAAGQIERGRTCGDDADIGYVIDYQLEVETDVRNFLRFINDEETIIADKRPQLVYRLTGEIALNGDVFTAYQKAGSGFSFQEFMNQRGFSGASGTINDDHFPRF